MVKIEEYNSDASSDVEIFNGNGSDAGPSCLKPEEASISPKKEPPSSSCGNLKSHFVGMGFSPTLVEKVIAENGEDDAGYLLETLLTYSALQNSSPAAADSLDGFSSSDKEEDDLLIDFSTDDDKENKELGGPTSFNLDKKAQLLSMRFSEEEVDSAINRLGENANLEELVDIIVAAQSVGYTGEEDRGGCASGNDGINEESAAETLFGTMDKTLTLLRMGFTESEVSRAIGNFGTDVPIWKLADSIFAKQNSNRVDKEEKLFHDSCSINIQNGSRCVRDAAGESSDFSDVILHDFEDEKIVKKVKRMPVEGKASSSSSHRKQPWVETDGKHSVYNELKYSQGTDLFKEGISDQFLPNIPGNVHGSVSRAPYFFYGNAVDVPQDMLLKLSNFLHGTEPEYVNSQFFSAFIRKEVYFHNLPTENRFPIHPQPPMTIEAALPHTKKWWPSWDTRKQLSSISSDSTGVDQLCERLGRMMANSRGLLSTEQQMDILHQCKKLNLMWVGHYKLRPIEPNELEGILGYPPEHTQMYRWAPSDRLFALKYCFQTDALGYHLSVLKDMFPDGLRLLSVYSGIGGVEIALHRLGIRLTFVVSIEACEINREILRRWWDASGQSGELRQLGGIERLNTLKIESYIKQFGGFDIIVGGNPGSNVTRISSTDNSVQMDMNQFFEFVRVFRAFQRMR